MSVVHESVVDTGFHVQIMTAKAMEVLEAELRHDEHLRAAPCGYCGARIGNPCHTRTGQLRLGKPHLERPRTCHCQLVYIGGTYTWKEAA